MGHPPTKLRLDPSPASAMVSAVEILSLWLPIKHLRLGGGTVLAARWHHRSSTDLGFFYSPGDAPPESLFRRDFDGIRMDLHRLVAKGIIDENRVVLNGQNHIAFVVGNVPVSFVRVHNFISDPCDETEHETGVILNSTRDILYKKMYHRLGINRLAPERDAYDLAVAGRLAPDDLAHAWSALTPRMKQEAIELYRGFVQGTTHRPSPSLINARYAELARDPWKHTLRIMEDDLDYAAPPGDTVEDTGRGRR